MSSSSTVAPLKSINRATTQTVVKISPGRLCTHTCGNPPAGSSAARASDVQTKNSFTTKTTKAEDQGPGRSKRLVEDGHLLDGASSTDYIRSSIESLLLGENELGSVKPVKTIEKQATPANTLVDLGEAAVTNLRLSALTLSSAGGSNVVNLDANLKSYTALTATKKAFDSGGNLEDADVVMTQVTPACHVTTTEKTKLVPVQVPVLATVGAMVNQSSRSESINTPMATEQMPASGENLCKRQKKRQSRGTQRRQEKQ